MDRLRRTLSFRKKKNKHKEPEASRPHQWEEDERKVREGTCSFQVKYLGSTEVFESRGMQVCEDACKLLRHNCKKAQRFSFRKKRKGPRMVSAILYVSGDSLRVVEDRSVEESHLSSRDDGQGLIVDQTIEKVSFCAPDRNHEQGFAYICRDGTSRRWLCHGFLTLKESGERLSHAVGCAFAVCLEKKQQREKESVQVSFTADKTSFTRLGSFRQASLTERLIDPQSSKIVEPVVQVQTTASPSVIPTAQIERPHASANMLMRMGSVREFSKLNSTTSPFKRNLSLRLNELPSNLQRQQAEFVNPPASHSVVPPVPGLNGYFGEDATELAKLPQSSSLASAMTDALPPKDQTDAWDPIAEMCQQLTRGLTGLNGDDVLSTANSQNTKAFQPKKSISHTKYLEGVEPAKDVNPWASDSASIPVATNRGNASTPAATSRGNTVITAPASQTIHKHTSTVNVAANSRANCGIIINNCAGNTRRDAQPETPRSQPQHTWSSHLQQVGPNVTQQGYTQTNGGVLVHTGFSPTSPSTTSAPANPFDTAWALRSPSNNPFHSSGGHAGSSSVTRQQHITKEFEMRM